MNQTNLAKPFLSVVCRLGMTCLLWMFFSACGGQDSNGGPTPFPTDKLRSDFNGDNCVGFADYGLLLENFNLEVDASREDFDINKDGEINFSDYSILLEDWGMGCTDFEGVAQIEQFPFVTEVSDANANHLCGGAIVDSSWVLTLATCTNTQDIDDIRIVTSPLDTLESADEVQIRGVEELAYFPEGSAEPQANDLVLIKVDEAFNFSDSLAPIALSSQASAADQSLQMVGWGILPAADDTALAPLQFIEFNPSTGDECEGLAEDGDVPITCVVAKNNSLLFDRVDVGAPLIRLEFTDASQNGLSYRLSGLAVTTDIPNSNIAVVVNLITDNDRITDWVESTLARVDVYGDIDGDGCIGDLDYQLYLDNNGRSRADAVPPEADVNGDGRVDFEDYAVLLQQWGQGCGGN